MIEIIKKLIRSKEKRLKNTLHEIEVLLHGPARQGILVPVRVKPPKNKFKI